MGAGRDEVAGDVEPHAPARVDRDRAREAHEDAPAGCLGDTLIPRSTRVSQLPARERGDYTTSCSDVTFSDEKPS